MIANLEAVLANVGDNIINGQETIIGIAEPRGGIRQRLRDVRGARGSSVGFDSRNGDGVDSAVRSFPQLEIDFVDMFDEANLNPESGVDMYWYGASSDACFERWI